MSKNYFVSIIVLNWNGRRFIDSFFESINSLDYPRDKFEVLFVDNNSSDDSVNYFLSKNISGVKYIQTGDNYGYSGGNNFGFKEARGEFIAVCNNDLVVDKDWLKNLIGCAQETGADVVVPKVINAHSKLIDNAGSTLVPDSTWPNVERGKEEPVDNPELNVRKKITAFCGASPLFRRSFLETIGLFDRNFFLYWEDVDLSWRGQKHHKTYVYEPSAIVYHATSGSSGGQNSPVFIYYVSRNRVLVLVKNGRFRYAFRAFLVVVRDHIFYKIKDFVMSVLSGKGRKQASKNLWLGIKIIGGIIWLTPLMLLKRYNIIDEEKI